MLRSTDSVVAGYRDTRVQPSLQPFGDRETIFQLFFGGQKMALISQIYPHPRPLGLFHYLGEAKQHTFFFLFKKVSLCTSCTLWENSSARTNPDFQSYVL